EAACRERLVDDLRAADVALQRDLEAGATKGARVELAEDVLLGEVLRPDRDRRELLLRGAVGAAAAAADQPRGERGHQDEAGAHHTLTSPSSVGTLGFGRLRPATGSVKRNVLPCPGWLCAQIRPPCCSMIRSQTASPMPVPGYSSSPWRRWKGWKMRSA